MSLLTNLLLDIPDATLSEGILAYFVIAIFTMAISILPLLLSSLIIAVFIYFYFSEFSNTQKITIFILQVLLSVFIYTLVVRLTEGLLYKWGVSLFYLFLLALPIGIYYFVVWQKRRRTVVSEEEKKEPSLLIGLVKFIIISFIGILLFIYMLKDTIPLFYLEPSLIFCFYLLIWGVILFTRNSSWLMYFSLPYKLYIASVFVFIIFFLSPISAWVRKMNLFTDLMSGSEIMYFNALFAQILAFAVLLQIIQSNFIQKNIT